METEDTIGRGQDGKFCETEESAQRAARAAHLRSRGMSYSKIALELSYNDASAARKACQRALLAIVAEPAEDLRKVELIRLDMMWVAALAVLEAKHFTVSQGKLIYIGEDPLEDDAPVLAAIDRLLKIQERRSKLYGLDAPVKTDVTITDGIDQQIQALVAQLAHTAP